MFRRKGKQRKEGSGRIKSGDFAEIWEGYHRQIYRYIYYKTYNHFSAEDLTAETFVKALEAIESFRGGNLRAWLYRIAHNLVVDHFRKHRVPELSLNEKIAVSIVEEGTEIDLSKHFSWQELREALKELTDDQRDVVSLKYISDFSNAEIAEMLGKSEGAITSLQYRALKALRRILDNGKKTQRKRPRRHKK